MGKKLYFLIYISNGRRSELTLREWAPNSKDFIRIKGRRASEIFNSIISVLDMYALKYNVLKRGNKITLELPADIGYAVLVYLLLTYSARKPKKWLHFLERFLAGKIPLSKYLSIFIDMAVDLSDMKYYHRQRKTIIKPYAARTVSSMMRILAKNL